MSRLSKILSVIFGICIVFAVVVLVVENQYFARKINATLASLPEEQVEIDTDAGRFSAFDTNDVEATELVLKEADEVGTKLASMQNEYIGLLSEYLNTGDEATMAQMQNLVTDFGMYFGDKSPYNGRWYMGTTDNISWEYYPAYDYGTSSIRLHWLCRQDGVSDGAVLCYFTALYDIESKTFSSCMKYDTGTGVSLYGVTKENPDIPKVDREAYGKAILDLAESIDAPKATHPTDGMSEEEMYEYWEGYWDAKAENY